MTTRKISAVGLSTAEKAAIESAIDVGSGLIIGPWQMVKSILAAEVIIVAHDTHEGRKTLQELVNPGSGQKSPMLVEYFQDEAAANRSGLELFLSSPLAYNTVIAFLKKLEIELKKPAHRRLISTTQGLLATPDILETVASPKPQPAADKSEKEPGIKVEIPDAPQTKAPIIEEKTDVQLEGKVFGGEEFEAKVEIPDAPQTKAPIIEEKTDVQLEGRVFGGEEFEAKVEILDDAHTQAPTIEEKTDDQLEEEAFIEDLTIETLDSEPDSPDDFSRDIEVKIPELDMPDIEEIPEATPVEDKSFKLEMKITDIPNQEKTLGSITSLDPLEPDEEDDLVSVTLLGIDQTADQEPLDTSDIDQRNKLEPTIARDKREEDSLESTTVLSLDQDDTLESITISNIDIDDDLDPEIFPDITQGDSLDSVNIPNITKGDSLDSVNVPNVTQGDSLDSVNVPNVTKGDSLGSVNSPNVTKGDNLGSVNAPNVTKGDSLGSVNSPNVTKGDNLGSVNIPNAKKESGLGTINTPNVKKQASLGNINTPNVKKQTSLGSLNTHNVIKSDKVGTVNIPNATKGNSLDRLNLKERKSPSSEKISIIEKAEAKQTPKRAPSPNKGNPSIFSIDSSDKEKLPKIESPLSAPRPSIINKDKVPDKSKAGLVSDSAPPPEQQDSGSSGVEAPQWEIEKTYDSAPAPQSVSPVEDKTEDSQSLTDDIQASWGKQASVEPEPEKAAEIEEFDFTNPDLVASGLSLEETIDKLEISEEIVLETPGYGNDFPSEEDNNDQAIDDDRGIKKETLDPKRTEGRNPFEGKEKTYDLELLTEMQDEKSAKQSRTFTIPDASKLSEDPDKFHPVTQLIGVIQSVISKGETAQITHKDYPLIRIFPENGWFVFPEELDSYPSMYREPAQSFSIESAQEGIKDELFNGRLPQSLWKLIFTAALFGSDGRLFNHLDRTNSFRLVHPPYFGMVPHTAEHISIAEYMISHTSGIEKISEALDIDLHTVIDFCNACDAIKLLNNEGIDDEINSEIMQVNITELEEVPTLESEVDRSDLATEAKATKKNNEKSSLINSLWSTFTKH